MREELEKAIGGQLRLLAIRTRNTLKITRSAFVCNKMHCRVYPMR